MVDLAWVISCTYLFHTTCIYLQSGIHQVLDETSAVDGDVEKLMRTQSAAYLHMKRGAERSKVDKLQSELHMLQDKPGNKHTIFVENEEELDTFDPAEHFDTDTSLVSRTCVPVGTTRRSALGSALCGSRKA